MISFLKGLIPAKQYLISGLVALAMSLAALGAGYVWGTTSATRKAMEIANQQANERVAALDRSYKTIIKHYDTRLKDANQFADHLSQELRAQKAKSAADAKAAKEKLSNVIDASLDRPVPVDVLAILREQPARH